jgi:hypothetical protein
LVIDNYPAHQKQAKNKIKAVDFDFSISVLDVIRMMRHAWSQFTNTTIKNCYRHDGFTSTQTTDIESEDEAN